MEIHIRFFIFRWYGKAHKTDWNTFPLIARRHFTIGISVIVTCDKKLMFTDLFQVFRGNFDRHTVVAYRFVPPFKAQFVRIHPKSWRSHISMRVEFYGCLAGMLVSQSIR